MAGFWASKVNDFLVVIGKSHGYTEALTDIRNMCLIHSLTSVSLQLGVTGDVATRIATIASERLNTLGKDIALIDEFLNSTQSAQVPISLPNVERLVLLNRLRKLRVVFCRLQKVTEDVRA